MSEESAQEWRVRILGEAEKLRANLKEARKRRERAVKTEVDEAPLHVDLDGLSDAHERLAIQTSRLHGISRQLGEGRAGSDDETSASTDMTDSGIGDTAWVGQLALLELAQKEMEKTAKQIEEFDHEAQSIDTDELEPDTPSSTGSTSAPPLPPFQPTQSFIDEAESTWTRMSRTTSVVQDHAELPTVRLPEPISSPAVPTPEPQPSPVPISTENANESSPFVVVDGDGDGEEDEQEEQEEQVVQPVVQKPVLPQLPLTKTEEPEVKPKKSTEFAVPSKPSVELVTFDAIIKPMKVKASPLVFFNLACFQGSFYSDNDVMQPICGYAIATHMLVVLGPTGTNTSVLRVALAGMEANQVFSTDFTVKGLVEVAEDFLRNSDMDPKLSVLQNLGLEVCADVVIGTCIQRGVRNDAPGVGTPRGSRTPEAPTPRKLDAKVFPGTQVGLYKSILLIEDLSTLLKAESIFKILRILRKAVVAERASAIVTLTRSFEKRGLFKLFDDALIFNATGVSYFGPVRGLQPYCSLVGTPCPSNVHIVDFVEQIPDMSAKYKTTPLYEAIQQVIVRFSGASQEQQSQADASAPTTTDDSPTKKPGKIKKGMSAFTLMGRRKTRKAKEEQVADALEGKDPKVAKKVMKRLADERRRMADMEAEEQKLSVWLKMAELEGAIVPHPEKDIVQVLLDQEQYNLLHKPSCFVNLACFITPGRCPDSPAFSATVAFASEGIVLGVMGSTEITDSTAFLNTLRTAGAESAISDLSVSDVLKIHEHISSRTNDAESLNRDVDTMVAKMMLTACSQEIVGTLVQRVPAGVVDPLTQLKIGDQTFSTAARSLLILDRLSSLDAQSLYVVLKLIRRISKDARLAVVFLTHSHAEKKGLFHMMDTTLIFNNEGMFYFGPSCHLANYCTAVDFPVPPSKNVIDHVHEVMESNSLAEFNPTPNNTNTPFTIRYQLSALAKYHSNLIMLETKPADQGGLLSSRTMVPKTFRKSASKADVIRNTIDSLELRRQKEQLERDAVEEQKRQNKQKLMEKERMWRDLLHHNPGLARAQKDPLASGIASICAEITAGQKKPCVFFNIASLIPGDRSARSDVYQPISAFALANHVVGLLGPPETDLTRFLEALATIDGSSMAKPVLLREFADYVNTSVPMPTLADAEQSLHIGQLLFRNQQPYILIISNQFIQATTAEQSFGLLQYVQQVARVKDIAVLLNLPSPELRRGLLGLTDHIFVFDSNGTSYFGPSNRLSDYLALVGFPVPPDVHPTDHIFALMQEFAQPDAIRTPTNTSPAVRFRFGQLAEGIRLFVENYIPSDPAAPPPSERRKSFFGPKKSHRRSDAGVEDAAAKMATIAEAEAEAERQRVAEANAELIWQKLSAEDSTE